MTATSPRTSAEPPLRRSALRPVLRIVATFAVLGALLVVLPVDDLIASIRQVPASAWPTALAVYLSLHLIGVAKWRSLINAAGAGLGWRDCAQAYYWGLFGNLFLPSIVGGDVVRAGVAIPKARSTSGLVLGSLLDRVLDVVGLVVLAAAGAILSPRMLGETGSRLFTSLAVLMGAGVLVLVAVFAILRKRRIPFRIRRILTRVRESVRAVASQPSALLRAFLAGIVLQGSLVVLNWWLGLTIGIDIPLYVWFFVWPLAKIAALVPLTQGGIGVREAAQAALFAPFGVPAVHAVATGLAFQAILLSGALLSGGIAVLLRRAGGMSNVGGAPSPVQQP